TLLPKLRRPVRSHSTTTATTKSSSSGSATVCSVAITSYSVVVRHAAALGADFSLLSVCPRRGFATTFMIGPPRAARSLHTQIQNERDAEEKGQALLKCDDLHGTPPPKDTTRLIHDESNVASAITKSLETAWRFSEEFLKVFGAGSGRY